KGYYCPDELDKWTNRTLPIPEHWSMTRGAPPAAPFNPPPQSLRPIPTRTDMPAPSRQWDSFTITGSATTPLPMSATAPPPIIPVTVAPAINPTTLAPVIDSTLPQNEDYFQWHLPTDVDLPPDHAARR